MVAFAGLVVACAAVAPRESDANAEEAGKREAAKRDATDANGAAAAVERGEAPRGSGEAPRQSGEVPQDAGAAVANAHTLALAFVGDVIFGRYREHGYDPIPEDGFPVFEAIAPFLAADVLVGNLETPLLRELPTTSPIGARFRFGASLEHARLLASAGFTAMSLANNHWFDLRAEGTAQTPALLREIGVIPLGGAVPEGPVVRVEPVSAHGFRLGFVAITARSNAPWRQGMPRVPLLETGEIGKTVAPILQAARADHDLLVVFVHWGDEYLDGPHRVQVQAAHTLIDAGADLVIGHHPHVLQGVEVYGRGLVVYSLGNFLFENTSDPPRLTGVLHVTATRDRCIEAVRFDPAYIKRTPVPHPVPATGAMEQRVKARVRSVSQRFGTTWTDDGTALVLATPPCPERP